MFGKFKYVGVAGVFLALTGCFFVAVDPYHEAKESVVTLKFANGTGGATGFLVEAKHGPVTITNWHVCEGGGNQVLYAGRRGEFEDKPKKVLGSDAGVDLCALEAVPGIALKLGPQPNPFEALHVLGHPYLKILTPADGRYMGEEDGDIAFEVKAGEQCPPKADLLMFMGFFRCVAHMVFGETTSRTFPGNSGSPVLNSAGEVVGVISTTSDPDERGGFIPVRFLRNFLEKF